MNYHSGNRIQRGRGIGSMFSGLFRMLKPFAVKGLNFGKKILASDTAKKIGSSVLDIGKNAAKDVLVDVLEGKNFVDSSSEKLQNAKSQIAETLAQNIKGAGGSKCVRKKKRKLKNENSTENSKKTKFNLLADEEEDEDVI